MKDILVNKINKKRPLGRPRTRWVDVVTQAIKNIKEDSIFDAAYDTEKWKGFVMATMATMVNGLTIWGRRKRSWEDFSIYMVVHVIAIYILIGKKIYNSK